MKRAQPVYLKTYGKNGRKLSAWFSPEDRKQAFDSSEATDGSVFEAPKPRRARGKENELGRCRAMRPAKKKAMKHLAEPSSNEGNLTNEEDIVPSSSSSPQLAQQPKTKRKWSSSSSQSAKRKAILRLMELSNDEENFAESSASPAQLSPQKKRGRKRQAVPALRLSKRIKNKQVFFTSSSEGETSAKYPESSAKRKSRSNFQPPSVSRFVTRRRRAPVIKSKPTKAEVSLLNSSDDFASTAFCSSRNLRSFRKRTAPPMFKVSSAENSLNAAGTSSFLTNPLREISLNEWTEQGLRLCPRKPILSSTPSGNSFSKCKSSKPFTASNQATTPPSISVSCIRDLSPSQEDSASPSHAEEETQNEPELHHQEEHSADVFTPLKRRSCSDGSKRKKDAELLSVYQLSTDSGDTSQFLSATADSEWLIEALKEKCLTEPCSVQLERLNYNSVTQHCSQTTYSSYLEHWSSVLNLQSNDQLKSVNGGQTTDQSPEDSLLELSVTDNKTSGSSRVETSLEQAVSETDSQSPDISPSVDRKQSTKYSRKEAPMEQPASVLHVVSPHQHTDNSFEKVLDTQLGVKSLRKTAVTSEEALTNSIDCLKRICSVTIQKPLKGFTQQREFLGANKTEKNCTPDSKYARCFAESTERKTASFKKSDYNNSPAAETHSTEQETEGKSATLTTLLKEKCRRVKPSVTVKRVPLSQLPKTLHVSHNDDQGTLASKIHGKIQGSTSSEENTASDKDVEKHFNNTALKQKKTSLVPKEKKTRSMSTDRPGTARKACVSGMSVSRWKTRGNTSKHGSRGRIGLPDGAKGAECSITELVPKQSQGLLESAMIFSTPVRAGRHNLSALLADLEYNTPTWSRLKAALSVHRKVLLSAKCSASGSPGREGLADISQDLFAVSSQTPFSHHLKSQLLSNHSIVLSEDESLSDANKVYAECGQEQPLAWEECILPQRMKRCVKIGEGTFGEVFSTTNASGETVALKIIPVEGSEKVNGEDQKTFGEILHEIIISKELSSLKDKQQNQTHGFIGLNDLHCVQGCYPPDFLKAWDSFEQRKGSENDRPDFFEKNQLFIILEFEFGGADLENSNGTLSSIIVAKSILHQVTAALAVAEEELHFEHRDLHWGNVLVKTTKQKKSSFLLNGATHSLETKGVLVRVIDYSLSRLEIDNLTVSCDISNDQELFMGQGDYQFDIYRLMQQENGNNWCNYHPHSNVLWLHYLSSKLLSMKYRCSGGRGVKDMQRELTRFHDNVLQYSSATKVLQNCPMFQ